MQNFEAEWTYVGAFIGDMCQLFAITPPQMLVPFQLA